MFFIMSRFILFGNVYHLLHLATPNFRFEKLAVRFRSYHGLAPINGRI